MMELFIFLKSLLKCLKHVLNSYIMLVTKLYLTRKNRDQFQMAFEGPGQKQKWMKGELLYFISSTLFTLFFFLQMIHAFLQILSCSKEKTRFLYRIHFIWGPFHELCLKGWNKKKNPQLHFFFVAAFPLRSCGLIMIHFFTQQTTIDHWIVRFPNFKVHLLQKMAFEIKIFY